jgi:mono/diheme cytochrome c family protein
LHLLAQEDSSDTVKKSIARGKELFGGTVASCSKCHGIHGRGDGQEADYDDWTKDWTTRIGLNPVDEKSLVPLIARGALPPRTIKPRNFEEGIFRGGSNPEDLYRRLTQGIAGTPMPAVTFVEGQLDERDVWNLINYIHSLKKVSINPSNAGNALQSTATRGPATGPSVDTL